MCMCVREKVCAQSESESARARASVRESERKRVDVMNVCYDS